jgi:uncharacterized protein
VVKAPKLHFFDSGLVCYLLGIREPEQLRLHPLRGAILESWVFSEIFKAGVHEGLQPSLFHYRESRGLEIDLLIDRGREWSAVEVKSGATIVPDFFTNLERFKERFQTVFKTGPVQKYVIYGGDDSQERSLARIWAWKDVHRLAGGT